MIDVRVREQNVFDHQLLAFRKRQEGGDFVTRIDQHRFPRRLAADDEAVFEERTDRLRLQYHEDHDSRGAR